MRTQLKRNLNKEWVLHEPKTRRSRRQIALAQPAADALVRHREKQQAERAPVGAAYVDRGLVFCTALGKLLIRGNVYRGFLRLLAKAGLPQVRFHDLRHACATLLLRRRANAKVVSAMPGHASISVPLDIYSHVIPDMRLDAAAIMAELSQRAQPTMLSVL